MATETDYAIKQCADEWAQAQPVPESIRLYDYVIESLDKQGKLAYAFYEFKSGRIYGRGKGWLPTAVSSSIKNSPDSVWSVEEQRWKNPREAEFRKNLQAHSDAATGRQFQTGAYRDTDNNKLDYEAFLSPIVLERYAQYMHKNRIQSDGRLRDGDNWQKGIPQGVYIKSAFRHFMDWWSIHRADQTATPEELEDALCALLFNVQGYLFEQLKKRGNCENRPVAQTLGARVTD